MSRLTRWWKKRKARLQPKLKQDAMNKLRIADLSGSNDDKALAEACRALLRALREQEDLDPNDPSRIDPNDPIFIRFREARWQTEMQIQCETMKHVWTEGAHLLLDIGIGITGFLAGFMVGNIPGGVVGAVAAVAAKKVTEPILCQPRIWNKRV